MKPTQSLVAIAVCTLLSSSILANPLEGKSTDVMLQGFTWLSSDSNNWYGNIASKAVELKQAGITMLWMPPPTNVPTFAKQGYLPVQLNVLDSYYGTEAQLKSSIQALHSAGIKAIADVVINHRAGFSSWHDFKNPDWGTDAIVSDDECWSSAGSSCSGSMPKGAADSGDGYGAARDIDHSKDYVRASIKTWMNERLKGVGFDGWRYDYVKGFNGKYVGEYNAATAPYFSVGEYWTTLWPVTVSEADNHRKLQATWIDQTTGNSAVFDFTTKGVLNDVIGWYKNGETKAGNNNYALLKGADGKPSGLIGLRPKNAVTFVDNHDTGSSGASCTGGQVHWAMTCDRLGEGYAYILTHPGIPSIYWGHYYDRGMKTEIDKLLKVRRDAGLHSESSVNIVKAEPNLYAAIIDAKVAVKLGSGDWNPGAAWVLATSGAGYSVWNQGVSDGNQAPIACFSPSTASAIKLGDVVNFDASCSTDSDGSIASFSWSLDGAPLASSAKQPLSFTSAKAYNLSLVVTDNKGKSSLAKTLVVNLGTDYAKTYDALYLRGSFNTWGKAAMALTGDNTWTLSQELPAATEFKFDAAPGNWTINFGDIQADGIADAGTAPNIKVATAGKYKISFNDKTKAYSVVLDENTGCKADNDGMDDVWEAANGLDACVNDAAADLDNDGLTNKQEFDLKTNPKQADTDADGYSDADEVKAGTSAIDKNQFPQNTDEPSTTTNAVSLYRGDFDGDGNGDLLWRNTETGELYWWTMQGTRPQTETRVALVADAAWQIAALADFNADAKTDLLWRNTSSGETLIWLMNGAAWSEQVLPKVSTEYLPYALDVNADKKADLFWRNTKTGENYLWLLNNAFQVQQENQLTTVPLDWQINGLADMDADGRADLVWRNANSDESAFWFMNGASYREQMLENVPNEWKIISAQDYDGDSKGDLLWRNVKTNEVYITAINNGRLGRDVNLGIIDPTWEVVSSGDYDHNGKIDLFWRNNKTGDNAISFFDGSRVNYQDVSRIPLSWTVSGRHQTGTTVIIQPSFDLSLSPASGSFKTTLDLTLSVTGGTISQCRYTEDTTDPKSSTTAKTCSAGQSIQIGATTAAGSNLNLKVYVQSASGVEVTQSATYLKTSSDEPQVSALYATNPNGQVGKFKTISVDGVGSEWSDDMIIAQGAANDDPRIFRGSHEGPVYDLYALYGAWDDTNLYLMWQFTNVTDVADPAQGYPISDNGKPWNANIPQSIAFDVDPSKGGDGSIDGTTKTVWDIRNTFPNKNVDFLAMFSSKPKVGVPALFKLNAKNAFDYLPANALGFAANGIEFMYGDGFLPKKMMGVNGNGWAGYKPSDLNDASKYLDFLTTKHNKAQDTIYEMKIPLVALGLTRSQLETKGIGVMLITTFGQSGIGSLPQDPTVLDNADKPYSVDPSTSMEKEDVDAFSVPFARVGKK